MAHEVETMFSGKAVTPWHGLGSVLEGTLTSARALEASGLDWRVRLEAVQVANPEWRRDGQAVPSVAILREKDSAVLGASGLGYRPVQNETLFAVGDTLTEAGARWETAGSLYGGRRVWGLMRLDESLPGEVVAGDAVRPYLLLANAHDGLRCAELLLTTVRVVCANTYRVATMSGGHGVFRLRHTANVEVRMAQAAQLLRKARDRYDEFMDTARLLNRHKVTKDEQVDLVAEALGIERGPELRGLLKKKLERAVMCLEAERASAADPDSLWTAFNGVTRFSTHAARVLGKGRDAEERRLDNSTWSTTAQANDRALAAATQMAALSAS